MGESLAELAAANGIPAIDRYDGIGLLPETYDEDKIFDLLEYFSVSYDGELILYGGQTATERIYGFKRIRDVTTDLDFVATQEAIRRIIGAERLFYHRKFDILFSVRNNVPVSLARDHIHDWRVDSGFSDTAETVRLSRFPVRCCSREYSIMLKMRRMNERTGKGLPPFGKDALDIINMAVAPFIRSDLSPIDFAAVAELLGKYVTADPSRLEYLVSFIAGYREHLTGWEGALFDGAFASFSAALFG